MKEDDLYQQLAQWLHLVHPELDGLWHFDLSGMWTPSHKARNLYGRLNKRAWPYLFIGNPIGHYVKGGPAKIYPGLFVELKRDNTRLKKKDGTYASEHIAEQAAQLEQLQDAGYIAQFAVGFDEATQIICSYLDCTHHQTEASHDVF